VNALGTSGFSASDTGYVGPLPNKTPLTFSQVPKVFSFQISPGWYCIGIAPSTDHNIKVDNDCDFSSPYQSSAETGTTRDFVMINGHIWGDATHYAQVYYGSPSSYIIESSGGISLPIGGILYSDSIGSNEIFKIYTISARAGKEYRLDLYMTPDGDADLAVFVFKPSRSSGTRFYNDGYSDNKGYHKDERVYFCAQTDGVYGIAVINENAGEDKHYLVAVFEQDPGCLPCSYTTYSDWVTMKKPPCWCGTRVPSPNPKWPYQCDGDADNLTQGLQKFRVYTNDFNILIANWRKLINDLTLNPCADFDHKPQGLQKFRVYTNDFNILVGNWKKIDTQLPGNCPRQE
jgi:hypothetical protein